MNPDLKGKEAWWRIDNLSLSKNFATNDMSDDMLRVFVEEDLSEFFYYKNGEDWLYDLK